MKRKGLLILANFFLWGKIFSQPVFFENHYGSPNVEMSEAVKQLPDGSIFMVGFSDSISQDGTYDPTLSKFDRFGNWLWTKHFTSPENDVFYFFYVLPDASLMMVGDVHTGGPDDIDVLLMKTDTSGNVKWKKSFGGPNSQSVEYIDGTSDGNLIACGYSFSQATNNDVLIVKLDTAGTILWQKLHGGPLNDYSDFIKQTADGGYISSAVTSSFGAGNSDAWIVKTDQNGDTLWTRTSGNQYSGGCQGVWPCSDGGYLLYGEETPSVGAWFNFFMTKYDNAGNLKWYKNFGGTGSDAIFDVLESPDKGFYCTGYSSSYSSGPLNLIFFKTDSLGNLKWKEIYGTPGIDIGLNMVPAVDGGFLIAGQSNYPDDQYYLLHLDSVGKVTWTNQKNFTDLDFFVFPNPSPGNISVSMPLLDADAAFEITDPQGKIILSGFCTAGDKTGIKLPDNIEGGVYFITLKKGDAVSCKKIIVSRN